MSIRNRLIELLADGGFHSGQSLGQELGITRAAVWKHIRALGELGLEIHAVRGRGYRFAETFEPLNADRIVAGLEPQVRAALHALDLLPAVDSTNEYLKRCQTPVPENGMHVCLAEWQSAGRGRRGRRWISPYGSNLYLSLAMEIPGATVAAGGLSLVTAIAVAGALRDFGLDEVGLKWPNDIFSRGRKLAGILLDLSGESRGPFRAIIGVGVNLKMPASAAAAIDQPWTDLSQSGISVDRNALAAAVVNRIPESIERFMKQGLQGFIDDWARLDLVAGRPVDLHHDHEHVTQGVARGIDLQGALLIEQNGVTRSYHAGEISVRLS